MKRHPGLSVLVHRRTSRASRRAACGAFGLWAWSNERDLRSLKRRGRETRAERRRRGSTLVVVMALLGMLLLLGVIYFTFSNQEQQSATYFAEAAKRLDDPGDDIDAIFDAAVKEVIQGGDSTQKGSALFGGRSSLLFTMLGHDLQPYSGPGVNLIFVPGTGWAVDQDGDGSSDPITAGYNLVELNDSPAARLDLFERNLGTMPAPDVDYTAADHNNPFLAYEGWTWNFSTLPPTRVRVIKPSFHRPELFRDSTTFLPVAGWATAAGNNGRSFRPHPDHLFVWRQGNPGFVIRRFVSAAYPEAGLSSFPFQVDLDGDGFFNEQGVWDRVAGTAATYNQPFEYDVDTDGDNERDAIWMDLDLPVLVRPTDNATYIPMIAFKIIDLDSKLNLNAIGNLSGNTTTAATTNFGNIGNPNDPTDPTNRDISISSMGLSSWEINPIWALDTLPSEVPAATLNDHTTYFHTPTTQRQLANMEWWWLNKGRVKYPSSGSPQIFAGRYGEANRMWNVLAVSSNAISVQQSNSNLFPFPGVWDANDNRDGNDGGQITIAGVLGGQTLPWQHPVALNGRGSWWNPANPKQIDLRSFRQLEDANNNGVLDPGEDLNANNILDSGPVMFLRYTNVGVGADGSGYGNVAWLNLLNGTMMQNTLIGANFGAPLTIPLPPNPTTNDFALVDDPTELTLESKYVIRPYDEPLEAVDTLLLHMSKSDRDRTGIASRVADLMPGNIVPGTSGTQNQLDVAKRFTTIGSDLKTFALPRLTGVRDWEFNVDYDGNGLPEFPPQFGSGIAQAFQPEDPFRPQLRRLLKNELGNTAHHEHTFRLGINELLDVERIPNQTANPLSDPLQYRPLTPHSTDITLTLIPPLSPLPDYPPTTEGEKEFWARRDRQQMARDIYVMLYTFCGGNDTINLTSASGITSYPANTRRMMAQFAVNMVDALDRDNVITAFEYDNNLANGWNLDDDASSVSAAEGALPAGERGVVFGVEAQELTFSEVLWLRHKKGMDNDRTPFNDNMGHHNYIQIELRSVSATDVQLALPVSTTAAKGLWRIHRDDDNDGVIDTGMGMGMGQEENALTFLSGTGAAPSPAAPIKPGRFYTIASCDPSTVGSASLYIDYNGGSDFELVAPNKAGIAAYPDPAPPMPPAPVADLDLVHTSHANYFALATGMVGDFLSTSNNPSPGMGMGMGNKPIQSLRLQRRMNPALPQLSLIANPFITVDEFHNIDYEDLDLKNVMQIDAAAELAKVKSRERRQPFDADDDPKCNAATAPSPLLCSISQNNSNSPTTTKLHQIHFDRDFASVLELFNIPLTGPNETTRVQAIARRAPETPAVTPPNRKGQLEYRGFPGEDVDGDGRLDVDEDANGNGRLDFTFQRAIPDAATGEIQFDSYSVVGGPFTFGAAVLVQSEDSNEDGLKIDSEDTNGNGILEGGEDTNGNKVLDFGEDFNGNGDLDVPGTASHAAPNHFHRLLSLVEVPTRSHRQLGDPLKLTRVPGKLNLNGINDPRILAALLDERALMNAPERDINGNGMLDPAEDLNGNGIFDYGLTDANMSFTGASQPELSSEPDSNGNGVFDAPEDLNGDGRKDFGRDWWFNFLVSRDGIDPISQLPLPMTPLPKTLTDLSGGIPTRPFRDMALLRSSQSTTALSSLAAEISAVEDTVLRRLPMSTSGRRLFELGREDPTPANDEYLTGTVDPTLRHRLLSKVVNNTSTRSNCFLVYVTIGMFECKELPNGATRVGAPMDVDNDGQPDTHRAVFIIDRSIAEEAYDKGSKSFDWKKLVLAKQRVN